MPERLRMAMGAVKRERTKRLLKEAGENPYRVELPKLKEKEKADFDEEFQKLVKEVVGKEVL